MSYAIFLRSFVGFAVAVAVSVPLSFAQQQGAGAGAPQQPGGNAGGGGAGAGGNVGGNTGGQGGVSPGRTPNIGQQPGQQQPQQFPEMQRPIYLSGKVLMDDGTPPPEQVVVERVCNGVVRPEGYTDSKGRFSFALGQNTAMMADASVSGMDAGTSSLGTGRGGGMSGMGGMGGLGGSQRGVSERDLGGCEIRASLAGFRSDSVNLSGRRTMDNPELGVIILHRLAKVDGFTFSGTTAYAPKDARKAFDKGREAAKKQKWPDAEKEFQKAVDLYPKYAVAWYQLGLIQQMQKKMDDARKAYGESLNADSKFVSPYAQLAKLAAVEQNWPQTIEYSEKLIKLNPYYSPEVYFYSAVANLNLKHLDVAEEHAREAVKLDPQHKMPKSMEVLAIVLAQKQDFKGAAENMRAYLKAAPDAPDAEKAKEQLEQMEQLLTPKEATASQPK
jgi:hypothetical protein